MGRQRVGESPSIGCRRGFLYAFSGIRGAEFLKKCDCKSIQMDSTTPGGFSTRVPGHLAHKWNIKSNNWRMKPNLTIKSVLRNSVRNSIRPDVALHKSASGGMPRPVGALSESQKPSAKSRIATFAGLRARAIPRLLNVLISMFRPRSYYYSAALNAAQR